LYINKLERKEMPTILIVEDAPEQIEIAKKALCLLGFNKIAVAKTLADAKRLIETLKPCLNGIITDLHFPEAEGAFNETADKPNGLAIVAEAVKQNIPVAVCSDINHHFCAYAKDVVNVLASHQSYCYQLIYFGLDNKDWHAAGLGLKGIIKEQ
jgi:CheY-like chemotaxis protein